MRARFSSKAIFFYTFLANFSRPIKARPKSRHRCRTTSAFHVTSAAPLSLRRLLLSSASRGASASGVWA